MGRATAVSAALGSPSGAVQQVPLHVGTNEPGVGRGSGFELRIEPGNDAVEVFHAVGEDTGVHQHPADEVHGPAWWQRIQDSVGERVRPGGELGEQLRGGALAEPDEDTARFLCGK